MDQPLARGLLYEKTGQLEQAEVSYAQAREIGVWSDATSQFAQGILRMAMAQPAELLLVECVSHQIEGKIERALTCCDRPLGVDPGHFDTLWKRGQLYAESGDWEAAVAAYTAAIEGDPNWPLVFYLRAQALIELGRTDEAQADLTRALELEPVDELRQKIEALQADTSQ